MRKKALLLTAVLGTGFILASCGGGGSTSSDGSTVSAYITDAPADQYPAVEVTLYEVRLTDGTNPVTLFSSNTGIQIDLTDLRNVMRYVGSAQIPAGSSFDRVEIEVGNSVQVTKNDGSTLTVSFGSDLPNVSCDSESGRCTITIKGINVSSGVVAVDFELRNMVIDETNNTITGLSVKPVSVDPKNTDMEYEIAGKVTSVDRTKGIFTVDWLGREINVKVDTATTVCPGIGSECLPVSGWCVEVETSDDPATSAEVRALEIERKRGKRCGEDIGDEDYTEPKEIKFKITVTDPTNQIQFIKDASENVTGVSISDTDGDPTISVDTSSTKVTVNGTDYNLSDSSVCEMESEMEGMESSVMSRDEDDEEDRRHRELADDYRKGPFCFDAIRTEIENMLTYLGSLTSGTTPNVEIEFELKVDPSTSNILKLELGIEMESEGSEGTEEEA